jgi:hypothetical protein
VDTKALDQAVKTPSVFGGNDVRLFEELDEPTARIAEIADGGRREDHTPRARLRFTHPPRLRR